MVGAITCVKGQRALIQCELLTEIKNPSVSAVIFKTINVRGVLKRKMVGATSCGNAPWGLEAEMLTFAN